MILLPHHPIPVHRLLLAASLLQKPLPVSPQLFNQPPCTRERVWSPSTPCFYDANGIQDLILSQPPGLGSRLSRLANDLVDDDNGIKDSIPNEDDNGINDWIPSEPRPADDIVGDDNLIPSQPPGLGSRLSCPTDDLVDDDNRISDLIHSQPPGLGSHLSHPTDELIGGDISWGEGGESNHDRGCHSRELVIRASHCLVTPTSCPMDTDLASKKAVL